MAETLPEDVDQPGEEGGIPPGLNGIAAAVATEHGAGAVEGNGSDEGKSSQAGKRGRPPTHGLYSKAMGSNGKNPVKTPGPGPLAENQVAGGPASPPRVVVPPELLAKVVKETLTLTENFAGAKIREAGQAAGLTLPEIQPQLDQAQLGETRKGIVADLTPYALKEWGLEPEMSPTVAICFLLAPWSFGAYTAFLSLARLAKEKAERERKEKERREAP